MVNVSDKKTKSVLIVLEESQIKRLDEIAKKNNMSRSNLVRLILDEGIKTLETKGLQIKLF